MVTDRIGRSPITIIYWTFKNFIRQVKNVWKVCGRYIKVHMATRWTTIHGLMLLWFKDLVNITEEVKRVSL